MSYNNIATQITAILGIIKTYNVSKSEIMKKDETLILEKDTDTQKILFIVVIVTSCTMAIGTSSAP